MQKVQIQTIPTKPLRRKRITRLVLRYAPHVFIAAVLAFYILKSWGMI